MKAIVYTEYGSPDVLQLKEVAKPTPKADEVLVKIRAASVNSWDWDLLTGKPLLYRLLFGLRKPRYPIIGSDIAGVVEAVGPAVTRFQAGDEVFGDISEDGFGAFAEYACAKETNLANKSSKLSFKEAAAVPQAAILALQGLRQGKIQEGQKVLINGAGGGVGSFAIQLAKIYQTEVTAIDSSDKFDLMRSLSADQVVDYRAHDYTSQNNQRYDLILDVIAQRSIFAYQRVLKPNGSFVMIGGSISTMLQGIFLGSVIGKFSSKSLGLMPQKISTDDLDYLTGLIEAHQLKPIIDREFSLSEVPAALRYLGKGRPQGKVVINVQ